MNFYASPAFLETLGRVYFPGTPTRLRDFEVDDKAFRLLEVGGKRIITSFCFYDYVEPLSVNEVNQAEKRSLFLPSVALSSVPIAEWSEGAVRLEKPAPYVDFRGFGSYAEYQAMIFQRGSRFKKNQRLRERLAEDFGELYFNVHDTAPDVFGLSFAWKSLQLQATGLEDIYADPKNCQFLKMLRDEGVLRCSTLRAGDRLLASWLGFVHEGVWSGWVFAHDPDPELKKYSLGWQLMESLLKECFESGLTGFDFSVGASDYKFGYGTHVRLVAPFGRRSASAALGVQLKAGAKQVLERVPGLLERAREVQNLTKKTLSRLGQRRY